MPSTNELLQEGRYRVSDRSAAAGGSVFEAYDTIRNTTVIVREIPVKLNKVTTVSQQESLKLAFASQAKALTEIQHDSLLHIHDFFSEIDRQYLVMEAVDGDDVSELLQRSKSPFTVSDVTAWADQLLDALNYLHARRPAIIHRNIRPNNLRLVDSGRVKLLGVGLEQTNDAGFAMDGDSDLRYSPIEEIWPGLDPASQKVITNSYDDRSERILKEPLDARSDIYSLGATLYFLVTGLEPVDPLERSIDILEGKLDPLREPSKVVGAIPPEISDVLMKALEVKRENRYDSAMIMRQVLQAAIARVGEREQDEEKEQRETAEIIRLAAEKKSKADAYADEETITSVHGVSSEMPDDLVESEPVVFEENLLEIPVSAEVAAYRENVEEVNEDELAAVLKEIEEAESAQAKEDRSPVPPMAPEAVASPVVKVEPHGEFVEVEEIEYPVDLAPAAEQFQSTEDDDEIFSLPEKTGSSLPVPAIAGAVGLVAVLAVGGWFMMSGSPEPPPQPAAQPAQVVQPAPVVETPAQDVIVSTSTQEEPIASTAEPATDAQSAASTRPAAPARSKKADAAKPQTEKKKAVTVDDLINDN